MRAPVALLVVLSVTACAPPIPESGPGFQDYNSYMRERAANPSAAQPVAPAAADTGFSPAGASAALDRAQGVNIPAASPDQGAIIGGTGTAGARPRGLTPDGIKEEAGETVHYTGNAASNSGISDEQDFDAVASRESIQSDKERIERNRAQYQIDQPGALPTRSGNEGPNIVQYALSMTHPLGTQVYSRSGFGRKDNTAACAKFASPDLAQEWFLANGGPNRDRRGLDPDGDGYACTWDPTPFRN